MICSERPLVSVHQSADRLDVFRSRCEKRRFHGIIQPQLCDLRVMGFLLLLVRFLQVSNLLLQCSVVAAGFFQGFQLRIPLRNRGFQTVPLLLHLPKLCFGDVLFHCFKDLFRLFLCQAQHNQFFFCHDLLPF